MAWEGLNQKNDVIVVANLETLKCGGFSENTKKSERKRPSPENFEILRILDTTKWRFRPFIKRFTTL